MKLFFDESFDGDISRKLCRRFPGSIYAGNDERFRGMKNGQLFSFLSGKKYVFISEDKHFLKESVYPAERTGGIVVVRKKGMTPGTILRRLQIPFSGRSHGKIRGRLVIVQRDRTRIRIRKG